MRKILFVDDETHVLQGLQRTLRSMRHEWDIAFAKSGPEGLETLRAEPFDVVVSDMRMPGMDGVQFLTQVREYNPQIVRIALSGYSDQELTLKSVNVAHQYLSKPCDADLLKQTLLRVCALRDLLTNETLKHLVSKFQSLPVLPSLYLELTRELELPDPSLKRIGDIIAQDVAMTAKVLQIVNSAFFGLKREVSSPKEAAFFLGTETMRSLVLSLQVFSAFPQNLKLSITPEVLWSHSMRVSHLAKAIAKSEKQPQTVVDEAFTAGLLHEIGILILTSKLPQQYAEAAALAEQEALPLVEAERRIFGVGHPEVGAYLLGIWGLPDTLVEAVAFHHEPSRCPSPTFTPLAAVHAADYLIGTTPLSEQHYTEDTPLDLEYLTHLGLNERVSGWQANLISDNN